MPRTVVYAGEVQPPGGDRTGVRISACAADMIELAAYRGQAAALGASAAERAMPLPALGHVARTPSGVVLAVRPDRWLLLAAPADPGSLARSWQQACLGCAAVIEHSAALSALYATGDAIREVLKRGCRLDLDPNRFPAGTAASTIVAQVPLTLAALADGMLLLSPSSTGRHFREWLAAAARPFGLAAPANASVALLSGEPLS
jgi:heterotetrameric sarcosine oxidase gamma subunit